MGGQMQASSPLITLSPSSPSFNSYSSGKFAEIAARVVQEFSRDTSSDIFSWTAEDAPDYEQYGPQVVDNNTHQETKAGECLNEEEDDEEEEFEFAVVNKEANAYDVSSTLADDIFYDGQIRPIYPLFNTSLISSDDNNQDDQEDKTSSPQPKPKRPQLRKLFSEERDTATSCSSSEADELDGASPGTYCVWAPKKKSEEDQEERKATHGGCKKSRSTGSKRWKIKDLLVHSRSNSDGKEAFVFLPPAPPPPATKKGEEGNTNDKEINTKAKEGKLGAAVKVSSAVEEHYVMKKSKDGGGGVKRRSHLPYRQDLVGFLSNVNGLGRNLHPF